MQALALEGGFKSAPTDAAHAFRSIMTAMARPGDISEVTGAKPPAPMSVAAGVTLLTLCDPDTPIYLAGAFDAPEIREWITFHTGAPLVEAKDAMFAVGAWQDLTLSDFSIGTAEYPDRSATLIVEVPTLENDGATLAGPGIKDTAQLSVPDTNAFKENRLNFPLGLDFIFTCGARLAGLPRSTRVG